MLRTLSIIANTLWLLDLRSFHGFSTTTSEPMLDDAPPPRNENPDIDMTSDTSGSRRRISSERLLTTFSVRSSDAPCGSCIDDMK